MQTGMWVFSLVVNLSAVVLSIETNDFDWMSYGNLACFTLSAYELGARV